MTPCPTSRRHRLMLPRRADSLGRNPIPRIGRVALPVLALSIAVAAGCGPGPEPQPRPWAQSQAERQPQRAPAPCPRPEPRSGPPGPPGPPDLSVHDDAHLDTIPVPDPFASMCERPRRLVGLWSDTITGPGTRVPPLAQFGVLFSEFETPLRCVARTDEEKKVLLQRTELADSVRWYDPNWTMLVATYGLAPDIGPGVRIEFVTQHADSLIAHAVKHAGGEGCIGMPAVTYPISVMAIPASDAKVVFREYLEVEPPCS